MRRAELGTVEDRSPPADPLGVVTAFLRDVLADWNRTLRFAFVTIVLSGSVAGVAVVLHLGTTSWSTLVIGSVCALALGEARVRRDTYRRQHRKRRH